MAAPVRHPVVPVTLLAGFLGAGKTTLLNRILTGEHGRRIAVLINDFGDVSIDQRLVVSADETSVTLANGCICCSIRDDLIGAVRSLLRRPAPPEHLVVEMSGIADPGSVLFTFALMEKKWPLEVDGVVALVDAENFPGPADPHHTLAREQLVLADVVLLNKVDLADPARVAELGQQIRGWVPTARLVHTVQAEVPLELLLGLTHRARASEPGADSGPHAAAAPGTHGFATFTYTSSATLSLERLRETCTELPPAVFRATGIVLLDARPDHQMILQIVGRRARLSLGEPWGERPRQTVIVFVGEAGQLDTADLAARFDGCAARRGAPLLEPLRSAVDWVRSRWRRG